MAAFVSEGKRIPRRGEIGLLPDEIKSFEDEVCLSLHLFVSLSSLVCVSLFTCLCLSLHLFVSLSSLAHGRSTKSIS